MDETRRYVGADWMRQLNIEMSPLGVAVADLLGDVYCGIYHLKPDVFDVDWANHRYIEMRLKHRSLATFDGSELTRLVFLAHDRAIRVELSPMSNVSFLVRFHQRTRLGHIYERHPTIEMALHQHRRYWPEPEVS